MVTEIGSRQILDTIGQENESDFGYITVVFKVQEEENLREKNLRDGLLKHLAMKIEEDKNESISQ